MVSAVRNFALALKGVAGDRLIGMRDAYAKPTNDGKPAIERPKGGGSTYDRMHEQYYAGFVSTMKPQGLADICLIDEVGRVLYSATRGEDYAVNLNEGKWAHAALSKMTKSLSEEPEPQVMISDIVAYPQTGPSLFISGRRVEPQPDQCPT